MRNNIACLAASVLGLWVGATPASAEVTYPWCAQYAGRDDGRRLPGIILVDDGSGGKNCGFSTLEQCRAALMGNGGWCEPNPMYVPGREGPPRHPRGPRRS